MKFNSNTLVVSCAVKSELRKDFTLNGRGRSSIFLNKCWPPTAWRMEIRARSASRSGSHVVFRRVWVHCGLSLGPRDAGVEWCFSDCQLSGEERIRVLLAPLSGEEWASRYRTAGSSSGMMNIICGEVRGGAGPYPIDGPIALLLCRLRRWWFWPVTPGRRYWSCWAPFEWARQTRSDMLILWMGPRYRCRCCEYSRRDPDRSKASRFCAAIRGVYSCPGCTHAPTCFVVGTQTHSSHQPAIYDHGRS